VPGALPDGLDWPSNNLLPALDDTERSFHAYVHIPFCTVRCGYCDFNTYTSSELNGDLKSGFHDQLTLEIRRSKDLLQNSGYLARSLNTVFFGGGTPSLFTSQQFEVVLGELRENFGIDSDAEITTEANPESTSVAFLAELANLGVNRLSMGVQSFDDEVLAVLDRTHSKDHVGPLVVAAKELGYEVSIDLIYGAPGETIQSWEATLNSALELDIDHISAYSLIVEPGTKLARRVSKGEFAQVDEDLNASKYELATDLITSRGLNWYEVSNWGLPSRHNSAYWASQDWWGYGPGAHSHLAGNRFWNLKHPTSYQAALKSGFPVAAREELTARQQLEEQLMLGLRTQSGISKSLLSELDVSAKLVSESLGRGLLTMDRDRIRVTPAGRLLVDRIVLDFLS
jgi:putative oxygen-independent coproporphyrinogen III oxidase